MAIGSSGRMAANSTIEALNVRRNVINEATFAVLPIRTDLSGQRDGARSRQPADWGDKDGGISADFPQEGGRRRLR